MALANITNNILTDSGILVTNLTPTSRTITINGVTYDLSADRSWTIAGGLSGSGTANQLTYWDGTSSVTGSATLTYSPTAQLLVNNSVTAASAIARGANFTPTLTAAANNDVLVGLDINPTFTNGAFTNTRNLGLRIFGSSSGNSPSFEIRQTLNTAPTWLTIRNSGDYNAIGTVAADLGISGGANQFFTGTVAGDIAFKAYSQANTSKFFIGATSGNDANLTLFTNGNVGIRQSTDAGFRLDVNGTIRASGAIRTDAGNGVTALNLLGTSSSISATPSNGTSSINLNSQSIFAALSCTANSFYEFRSNTSGATLRLGTSSSGSGGGIEYYASFNSPAGFHKWFFGGVERMRLDDARLIVDFSGTNAAEGSACLQANSTTRGFLPPRQTQTQRNAIATPAAGLIVYDTTDNELDYYNGTAWQSLMTLGTQQTVTGFKQFSASRTASLGVAQGTLMTPTLTASANNDVLVGLDVSPTFNAGAFTLVSNIALRTSGGITLINSSSIIGTAAYPLQVVGNSGGSALFSNASRTQALNINLTTAGETRIYGDYFGAGVDQKLILGTYAGRTNQLVLHTTNNVGINTATDAGFKFDVNGTARVTGNLTANQNVILNSNFSIGSSSSGGGIWRASGNGPGTVFNENMQAGQISWQFASLFASPGSKPFLNAGNSIFNINVGLGNPNVNNLNASILLLDGAHNITANTGTIIRGIFYNPTLTSLTGVISHRAIETSTGDVLLGTTSGSVGIGASTTPAYKLEVNNSTGDNHIAAVGTTPSLQLMSANTSPANWGTIGMATATNNFIVGSAAGDLAIVNRGTTAGNILFGFGSTERMRLTNAGNLGIGTSNPTEKLEVNGNIKATNLLSGTYTPTLTLVGNAIGSVAVSVCLYTRVGNLVTVTGTISGTGSGTGIQQYSYELSLPITQTNTNLRGTATGSGQVIGGIGTNGLNGFQFNTNKMLLEFQSLNTFTGAGLFWNFTFTYEIA